MSRQMRKIAESGTYHVMLRGINRQVIFDDNLDKLKFIKVLQDCKEVSGFKLYAYCIMSNHVHLLIRTDNEPLQTIFRRIGARYVYWYNAKYDRVGHLFQDRFRSEPITDDAYFLDALRYILNNPVKAGLCKSASQYKYSSYSDYRTSTDSLTDTSLALDMIGDENFDVFLRSEVARSFIDVTEKNHIKLTDEQASEIAAEVSKKQQNISIYVNSMDSRCAYVSLLRGRGLSLRQIALFSGLTKSQIDTAVRHL